MEPVVLSRRVIRRVSSVIVFLVIVGIVKESHGQITFIEEPKSATVFVGNPVSFNCTATSSVTVKYNWQFKGTKFSSSDGRATIHSDGTLEFTNVKPEDDGDYTCVAVVRINGVKTRKKSQKAFLTVQSICSAATLTTVPDNAQHGVGRKIEMTCDCSSNPAASIAWFKDGSQVTSGGHVSISGNKLVIDNLQISDSGSYSCNGSNVAGSMSSASKNIQVINAVEPTFDSKPKPKVYAKLGDQFQMACRASGTPSPTIEWYYDTQSSPLISSSKHTVDSAGSLTLLKVERIDFAKYKCVAKNFLSSISVETTLFEAKIEDFRFDPSKMYAEIGEYFQTTCNPVGVPKPKVKWETAKGGPIPASYTVDDYTITNTDVKEADSVNVTCVATNIAGTKKANLEIKTAVFPSITTHPTHTRANENSKIKLECTVKTTLGIIVGWAKNNQIITQDSLHKVNSNNALVFKKISKSDEGVYQCFVRTKEDRVTPQIQSRQANLTVNAAVRLLKYNYNHNKFDMGSKATVYCEFTGYGNIKVKWHRSDGKPLSKDAEAVDDHLTITNIQMQDEGNYICTGFNSFSNASASVNISVYIFPRFVLKPNNLTIVESGSAWLHCNATGFPKPKISWGKEAQGGDRLDPERFREFENGTLHVFNIKMKDQGRYYCYVGNIANFKQVTISLKVIPPTPTVGAQNKASAMGRTIAIAVGCAAAYIVLVVGLMIYCKRRRAKQQKKEQIVEAGPIDGDIDNCEANPEMALQPINGKPANYNKMEFPRHDLEALRTLGNGSYGRAFLARASGIKDGERETMVVVKSLMSKDDIQKEDFWRELNALINMDNPHVVGLLGVCRDMDPLYMIFESFDKGDLKQHLLSCYENGRSTLTSGQKLSLCSNIVSGMTYLASNNFTHKDIAARNCMVTKDLQVKIGFLSLSYDLYSSEYYRFNNILIPLKWMAPEAIFSDEFSEKSDVWSYGVLVWEVYTLGQTPFEDRSDEEVLKCIKEDLRLTKPENCPDTMAGVMKKCWEASPEARPTFDKLYAEISEIAVDTHL